MYIMYINVNIVAFYTGLVELRVKLQHHDQLQTVLSVDLGSIHRAHEGNTDYRLDKADITQRNNWELVIMVGLHTGVISTVKSKPFRITTRSIQKAKSAQQNISSKQKIDQDIGYDHIMGSLSATHRIKYKAAKLESDSSILFHERPGKVGK